MGYKSLEECIIDLEKHGHLIRVKEQVDPYLEMAAIHLRVYEKKGPALLFENIKNTRYRAVSNLFGSIERSRFLFRDTIEKVKKVIQIKADPSKLLKNPFQYWNLGLFAINALPKKVYFPNFFEEIKISDLPLIQCWEKDGGAFITLPIVYTEDIDKPGVMASNIGMYRIQLTGNEYVQDKEIGLHYQLHRGIGVHQTKSNAKGQPLKVSIFVGGPPSLTFSAVMPLPEGIAELTFAGALGKRRFRYFYDKDGFCIANDADFVITGYVYPNENKPEGPFGDHLGYYSLKHDFPLMRVNKVYAKKNALWAFTVVGRPPQEDTSFGALIHELTGDVIPAEIPGVKEVHAVDASGVHPLLIAIGSERYTPYYELQRPQELLTIVNHILGTGQMSLAKFLYIINHQDNPNIHTHDIQAFFEHLFERVDFQNDVHFYTKTTIDTLDYSGEGLNTGSKMVIAAVGKPKRTLAKDVPSNLTLPNGFKNPKIVFSGVLAIQALAFQNYSHEIQNLKYLGEYLYEKHFEDLKGIAHIIICDDSDFVSRNLNNWLWVTYTRANPSHDVYGVGEFIEFKHWGSKGALIIDARIKPHHAPPLEKNPEIEKKVDKLFEKGGSLYALR
ncbi:MAG: 3-octaprenyl-4-hydroxybenzoate carboxy-lyase [Bacteroidia bacterium]|nr:MAG: 3-octaprenyl-4-hydroxybenzoate carboxy-lyase [Bacteroidia bacterium]